KAAPTSSCRCWTASSPHERTAAAVPSPNRDAPAVVWQNMETKGHVWVMGAGAFTSRRLPVGLADRLAKLKAGFTIIREPLGIWLPVELRGIQVVRLADEFTNFTDRIDNYQRVARRVVEAARDGSEVMYITYGSPVIFDRVLSFIRNMCFEANLLC